MKITGIETIPYLIPYAKALRFASGEVSAAEHVLVRVHTDEGLVGTADAPPRPFTYGETQAGIIAVTQGIFAPQLEGLSPLDREVAHTRMARTVGNPAAKSAIDMALWDLVGQTLGVSVTELLGGFTDHMRVAHMVGYAPVGEMVAEAERIRDQFGITSFKVKVGRHPIQLDIDACKALRGRSARRSSSTSTATGVGHRVSRSKRSTPWTAWGSPSQRSSVPLTTSSAAGGLSSRAGSRSSPTKAPSVPAR